MSNGKSISIIGIGIVISVIICIIGLTLGIAKFSCWFCNTYLDPAGPVKFWLCLILLIIAEFVGLVYLFADEIDNAITRRFSR